ncbi:hypothetical protein NDA03_24800 [Trichocoleus sp. Lan]|uniref:hypothetical protein n=1 Tax=Trichocoleus sp. Lan TaxID=2933927 RepID=UPI00329925B9
MSKLSVTANLGFPGTPPNQTREIFRADEIPEWWVHLDRRASRGDNPVKICVKSRT